MAQTSSAGKLMPKGVNWPTKWKRREILPHSFLQSTTWTVLKHGNSSNLEDTVLKVTAISSAFYVAMVSLGNAPLTFAVPPSMPHSPFHLCLLLPWDALPNKI